MGSIFCGLCKQMADAPPGIRVVLPHCVAVIDPPDPCLRILHPVSAAQLAVYNMRTIPAQPNGDAGAITLDGGRAYISNVDGNITVYTQVPFSFTGDRGTTTLISEDAYGDPNPPPMGPVERRVRDVVGNGGVLLGNDPGQGDVMRHRPRSGDQPPVAAIAARRAPLRPAHQVAQAREACDRIAASSAILNAEDVSAEKDSCDSDGVLVNAAECPVCRANRRRVSFACGHAFCAGCSRSLTGSRGVCPLCDRVLTDARALFL